MNLFRALVVAFLTVTIPGMVLAQSAPKPPSLTPREKKVREDKAKVEAQGRWIYNDLNAAFAKAKSTGKPLLVVLRCIPCEECVKLDDDLVDNDPVLKPLLEQFVCARVVGTNGLDLNLFQYDTDQSFAVFMLNADKTIYGRFGTRSHRTEWLQDVSLEGMAQALSGALELHDQYPENRQQLLGKQGQPLEFATPEKYPSLSSKYTDKLNYEGEVVKSCIHCHQISEARREYYWHRGQKIPEQLLYPYPHPKSIGLVLDPTAKALVKSVIAGSPAESSGMKPGDEIVSMNEQPLLSMADVQWVLHNTNTAKDGTKIPISLRRQGKVVSLNLALPENWRSLDDTSWRVSAWQFSRFALGGMRLEAASDEEKELGAIFKVKSIGQYGAHATAKNAGLEKGDLILAFDGQKNFKVESEIFAYVNDQKKVGDKVKIELLQGEKAKSLTLPIQE